MFEKLVRAIRSICTCILYLYKTMRDIKVVII